jgi:hypothetical protein
MKQVPQNEMDVLLRKLGQGDHATETEVQSSHLDPDELSAYAENVLPPAARAKYTEHLLDCTTCRSIVADLAPSTVLVSKKEEAKPSGILAFFSNLITPSFLRYAVPSLAGVLILAMGFFMFNRQSVMKQATEMVAQNESQQTAPTSQQTSETKQPAQPAISDNRTVQNAQSTSPADKAPAKTTTAVAQPESTPASSEVDEVRGQAESQKRAEVARADSARQAAAEPPPAAPQVASTAAPGERELAKSKTMAENKKEPVAETRPAKEEARKLEDYDAAANAPKAQAAPQARRARMPGVGAVAGGAAGRDNQPKDDNETKQNSETRQVAGRTFRKVKGVWTDSAYDGRETTNLSRGSEQFRALVADEPGLRTIAEQLDGQIVVVWKGRAYRIR